VYAAPSPWDILPLAGYISLRTVGCEVPEATATQHTQYWLALCPDLQHGCTLQKDHALALHSLPRICLFVAGGIIFPLKLIFPMVLLIHGKKIWNCNVPSQLEGRTLLLPSLFVALLSNA
jgi:hypothetical protein